MKLAFLFPGQGSQYPGMFQDFFQEFKEIRELLSLCSQHLKIDLESLMFYGTKEELQKTSQSQLAIFMMSIGILKALEITYPMLHPSICAGLSLGEYSALYASGKIKLLSCLDLVKKRGALMQKASELHPGGLSVVLGLETDVVEKVISDLDEVWIANLNCPLQVVLSGTHEGLKKAEIILRENGAKRVMPLDVSGAFHSGLMHYAQLVLKPSIEQVHIKETPIDLVMNVSGEIVKDVNSIKNSLINQVTSTTRWEKSISTIERSKVDAYLEIGPGKTLSGMNRKIGVKVPTFSIEHIKDLSELKKIVLQNV